MVHLMLGENSVVRRLISKTDFEICVISVTVLTTERDWRNQEKVRLGKPISVRNFRGSSCNTYFGSKHPNWFRCHCKVKILPVISNLLNSF